MKYTVIVLALIFSTLSTSFAQESEKVPFEGVWQRSFAMGEGQMQEVVYTITSDSITFEMKGAMSISYVIKKDIFLTKPYRFIGKNNDTYYVLFVKNHNDKSIDLFKQKVESIDEAKTLPLPAIDAKGKFTTWNTYFKD